MNLFSNVIKFLKDPHGNKIQNLKDHYQELDELSNIAAKIGDASAYKSLQAEMREVFFDYLTAIVVDSIYRIVPHILLIWLVSLIIPTIKIPLINWQVNIFALYFVAYFTYYIGGWVLRYVKTVINTKSSNTIVSS
ncbi:hypothetical protein JCM14036_29600 [Desulfotomaculum defluvii]